MNITALTHYATEGIASVNGMLQSGSLAVIWSVIELQDYLGVTGDVAEIGVFQGKTFLLLCHGMAEGEQAFAVDVFGQPPGSNQADLEIFRDNMKKYGFGEHRYALSITNSRETSTDEFKAFTGCDTVRLFSVDGDHSKDGVLNDLGLAAAVLSEDGVIVADDLFNPWYPTVTEAVYEFFMSDAYAVDRGDLQPIAFSAANGPVETGASKLFIARANWAAPYKAGLKLLNQDDLKHCDAFAGFADVPTFYFHGEPSKRPLDQNMRSILDEILAD